MKLKTYLILAAIIVALLVPIIDMPWDNLNFDAEGKRTGSTFGTTKVSVAKYLWMMK